MEFPTISIITPSFNQGNYIEETILSVIQQDYPNIEYIIIDGGSSDNTVDVIRKYEDKIAYWISEPDKGQPDAINKGLRKATGEVIAFINSDDCYEPGAFQFVAEKFREGHQWIIGSVNNFRIETSESYIVTQKTDAILLNWLLRNNHNHQPGNFWTRKIYEQVGFMSESLHYSFDWDYWLRFTVAGFEPSLYNEKILAKFRLHDESKTVKYWSMFNREYVFLINKYSIYLNPADKIKADQEAKKLLLNENLKFASIESINGRFKQSLRHFKTAVRISPTILFSIGFILKFFKAMAYMPIKRKLFVNK